MGVVAGTLYRNPMVRFLLWTIYFYDFESYLFDRELFYEKAYFQEVLLPLLQLAPFVLYVNHSVRIPLSAGCFVLVTIGSISALCKP